jgi:hypothetical protein
MPANQQAVNRGNCYVKLPVAARSSVRIAAQNGRFTAYMDKGGAASRSEVAARQIEAQFGDDLLLLAD